MKKKSFLLSFLILFALLALVGCKKHPSGETLSKVTLNEVAHSIFYAPQYVAIQEGYFAEEGIDLNLVTGFGADKTMTAVLSGEADIGFMGAEATIYAYAEGAKDSVVNFAQLTQRAGNFLVAREEDPDFSWQDLKGKKVLGGRKGGMPEMVFEEQEGSGYVVASLGVDSGYVPYTAYCAKSSYLKESPQIIQGFTNALQKGMDYVHAHTPAEIAQVIKPQFDDTDMETLTAIVKRYQEQDTWKDSLIFEKDSFLLLSDILESAGELSEKVPYEQLVTTDFAKKAASH